MPKKKVETIEEESFPITIEDSDRCIRILLPRLPDHEPDDPLYAEMFQKVMKEIIEPIVRPLRKIQDSPRGDPPKAGARAAGWPMFLIIIDKPVWGHVAWYRDRQYAMRIGQGVPLPMDDPSAELHNMWVKPDGQILHFISAGSFASLTRAKALEELQVNLKLVPDTVVYRRPQGTIRLTRQGRQRGKP